MLLVLRCTIAITMCKGEVPCISDMSKGFRASPISEKQEAPRFTPRSSGVAQLNDLPSVKFALLLPFAGAWAGGSLTAGAAALAVENINADKNLLPGRRLEYSWADSGCSGLQGLQAMNGLLEGESGIIAVIGPACSSACEVTSYLSTGKLLVFDEPFCRPCASYYRRTN